MDVAWIVFYNFVGCELGRYEVPEGKSIAEALDRILIEEHIVLDEGDTINIESGWAEE